MFTRHAHRSADLYAPVPTTAPVKVVEPDASLGDPVLANIPAQKVISAWRELVKG
jgi:heptosyltransferase-2/heptosyltransferase-3